MREKVASILMIATGCGIATFWILFFTVGMAPRPAPPCYFAFEHSFVLPDFFLCAALIAGGVAVLKGMAGGRPLALAASGALVFLGSLDFSFNVTNGVYATSPVELVTNGFINLWCVIFGIILFLIFRTPSNIKR